jgi:hypothetical protein
MYHCCLAWHRMTRCIVAGFCAMDKRPSLALAARSKSPFGTRQTNTSMVTLGMFERSPGSQEKGDQLPSATPVVCAQLGPVGAMKLSFSLLNSGILTKKAKHDGAGGSQHCHKVEHRDRATLRQDPKVQCVTDLRFEQRSYRHSSVATTPTISWV